MSNLSEMGCGDVYSASDFEQSGLSKTCRIIPSRWVTADKGAGVVRARIVLKDVAKGSDSARAFCIPQPFFRPTLLAVMMVAALKVLLPYYCVLAAFTDEFLQAFNNLGLDQWTGIEMDVAWGHVTSQYGLHRPSITGPIFVYRVCTNLQWTTPPRVQILTHANLSPEQVLSAIAGHFPDLRCLDG